MSRLLKKITILFLLLYLPFCSMAWGVLGHRIVGQIADSYLTKKAKREITKLLGNEYLSIASTWSDFMRSDPASNYLDPWHYINLKSGYSETALRNYLAADTVTDVYTKSKWLIGQLKSGAINETDKIFYLRMLIHMVEDIHQPMHVAHPDDKGGNGVKLQWFGSPTNLHTVWDSKLIDFQQLSYTEYAAVINFTTKEQRKQWQSETIEDWIWQSYQYTEKIYAETKADANLGYDYNFKFISVVNQQLLKGGVHLAGLLNEIFN